MSKIPTIYFRETQHAGKEPVYIEPYRTVRGFKAIYRYRLKTASWLHIHTFSSIKDAEIFAKSQFGK